MDLDEKYRIAVNSLRGIAKLKKQMDPKARNPLAPDLAVWQLIKIAETALSQVDAQ